MLETSKERVKLLKMGIEGKTIEKLYVKHNGFKIIDRPILLESIEDRISCKITSFLDCAPSNGHLLR
jgi:hypothetical protein